jgi:hypothetical protein
MSKALRLSEKWFRRGLWLVAVVFAGFLIGLGGTIVGDLPKVETPLQVDDFLDRAEAEKLRAQSGTSARPSRMRRPRWSRRNCSAARRAAKARPRARPSTTGWPRAA